MPLKIQLQTTKKGALSVAEYFEKMENIADSLTLASYKVSEEDLIMSILAGLPSEYDVAVGMINARMQTSDVTIQEVEALMMTRECRIEQHDSVVNAEIQHVTTNMAENRSRGGRGRGFGSHGRGRGR